MEDERLTRLDATPLANYLRWLVSGQYLYGTFWQTHEGQQPLAQEPW